MPACTVSGVPEIVAVLLELDPILRPWGSTPVDTDQLKGPTPPAAAMVWVYAVPIVPSVKAAVVIDRRGGGGAALPPPQLVIEKPQARATAIEAKETKHWNLQQMEAVRIGSPLGKGWCEADTDEWSSSTAALVGCVNNINVRRATHVFLLCSFLALPLETIGSPLAGRACDTDCSEYGGAQNQEIDVFLGNGDGTFQHLPAQQFPQINTDPVYQLIAGDFNHDGKLDLLIGFNDNGGYVGSGDDLVLALGNGDGTFQTPTTLISHFGPVAVADVNNDGYLDLIQSRDPGEEFLNGLLYIPGVTVYLGGPGGKFTPMPSYNFNGLTAPSVNPVFQLQPHPARYPYWPNVGFRSISAPG